jgi:hypothetical protein
VTGEGLRHALGEKDRAENERQREEDVDERAVEVDPEVAQEARCPPREAAHDRCENGHPDSSGDELLHREATHLGRVRHRRLAAVVLPVRVRDEAGSRVQRDVRWHPLQVVGVQEEMALEPLERVQHRREEHAEDEDRLAVALPVLITAPVRPDERVEATLDPAEPAPGQEAFVIVDTRHVDAERVGECDEDGRVDEDLPDSLPHLEPLSSEERVDEVSEYSDGDHEAEDVGGRHQTRSST